MTTKRAIILGCSTIVFIGAAYAYVRALQTKGESDDSIGNAPIVYFDGAPTSYAADLNIDEILVGGSQNIFVGKVFGQSATKRSGGTQFDVEVLLNIKGDLRGRVVVNTNARYTNGAIRVLKGSMWPQTGSTYLFATRYSSENNWYTLIAFYTHQVVSWKLISDNTSLTTAQLQQLAASDPRVNQLQAAYPREVVSEADIYHNNVRNSYKSLSEVEKAALPHYTPPPPPPPAPTSSPTSTGQ